MSELINTLHRFDTALNQIAPQMTSRLQLGLTIADIEAKTGRCCMNRDCGWAT